MNRDFSPYRVVTHARFVPFCWGDSCISSLTTGTNGMRHAEARRGAAAMRQQAYASRIAQDASVVDRFVPRQGRGRRYTIRND